VTRPIYHERVDVTISDVITIGQHARYHLDRILLGLFRYWDIAWQNALRFPKEASRSWLWR
jgi:hypothetical protein